VAETTGTELRDRILRSRLWHRALARAQEYLDGTRDVGALLRRVNARLESAPLVGDALEDTRTLVRLVRAYAAGRYRDVAVDDLLLVLAGMVYFVSPLDLIPDLIAGVGLIDDLVVLRFVLRSVPDVLGRFRAWEARQGEATGIDEGTGASAGTP
jgi:uncharacterized membrane protein YkvA (DUF1232 family)